MGTSNPDHDFGSSGAGRAVRVTAETITTMRSIAAGITDQPSASLALVLGFVAGSDAARTTPGRIAALCDELSRRGEYRAILDALDAGLARRIDMLYAVDRGQRWAATGRR